MSIDQAANPPGGFAHNRFKARRRAWRRTHWWTFPFLAVVPLACDLFIALLTGFNHEGFLVGFGFGAGIAAALMVFDSPPAHIERWRAGAEGEKSTARALRPLLEQGWALMNDIDTGHGNIDHVLIGPAGVFALESKRLSGQIRVEAGTVIVRWHEDPYDGYQNDSIARRARGIAAELHARMRQVGPTPWVQAVVVLWADFDQKSIESSQVAWIHGSQLASVLARRPIMLSEPEVQRLTAQAGDAVSTFQSDAQSSNRRQAFPTGTTVRDDSRQRAVPPTS